MDHDILCTFVHLKPQFDTPISFLRPAMSREHGGGHLTHHDFHFLAHPKPLTIHSPKTAACTKCRKAELALTSDETPVACVLVHNNQIIARGMNDTNRSLNGTRHAEYMAITSILSPKSSSTEPHYPPSILRDTDLYVTVEPCVMCASLLRQYGIRKVYYGAINERFGGTGGVFSIHNDPYMGIEPGLGQGYEVSGGWLREEAIMLLRRFYVQQNGKGRSIILL